RREIKEQVEIESKEFVERLKLAINNWGARDDFAVAVNADKSTVSRWLRGKRFPDPYHRKFIARVLRIDEVFFFSGTRGWHEISLKPAAKCRPAGWQRYIDVTQACTSDPNCGIIRLLSVFPTSRVQPEWFTEKLVPGLMKAFDETSRHEAVLNRDA